MSTVRELRQHVRDMIVKHPELRSEMLDLLELCIDEIEEGGSPSNEIHLCMSDIDQLIKNQEA